MPDNRRGQPRVWGRADWRRGESLFPQHRFPNRPVPRPPSPPLGEIVEIIHRSELVDLGRKESNNAKITNCRDVASYNWMNSRKPTILVPGKPPAWTPPGGDKQLKEDAGEYYRDPNAARFPKHPMEPAIRAAINTDPTLSTFTIDIVACSSTFGNLLRFIRNHDQNFRMLVEVKGSTVFFVRRENSPTELIPGIYGYGHTFPENYTSWPEGVGGSECHQRVIRYELGGFDCLVRFSADGFLPESLRAQSQSANPNPENTPVAEGRNTGDTGGLEKALKNISLSNNQSKPAGKNVLKIRIGGHLVPQSAIFDLKTRSIRKKETDVLGEEMGRLWVAQIPNFVLAFHEKGLFRESEISVQDVRSKVQKWEEDNSKVLQQFVALLRKLVSLARSQENGRFELRRRKGSSILEVREQVEGVGCTMPEELARVWI